MSSNTHICSTVIVCILYFTTFITSLFSGDLQGVNLTITTLTLLIVMNENLFARTWDTVRRYPPGEFGPGLQIHDAQHWHQRAYGGLVELEEIEADKIGHAAAYEAHRIWHHHPHLYKHLTSTEQRRESFIALAIAEATKLMQYAGHRMDSFERTLIAESAAATASRIFHETMEPRHAQVIIPPPGPVIIDDSYHSGVVYIPPSPAPCCQI